MMKLWLGGGVPQPTVEQMLQWGRVVDMADMMLGEGMRNEAARLGADVTGAQLTGEMYVSGEWSYAVFERGEMKYYSKANKTAFLPFTQART